MRNYYFKSKKCLWKINPSLAKAFLLILFLNVSLSQILAQTYNMSNTPQTTCAGNFYDSGGSGGNYADNASYSQTFTSGDGNRIKFSFSSYDSWGNDVLRVYDGPDNTYPLIASLSGTLSSFSIESTGSQLTFVFSPDNNNTSKAGWAASISCTTPVLTAYNMSSGTITACSGVFYDDGGSGANYSDNQDQSMTFYSGSSNFLQFTFNTTATALSSGDSLFVYDGSSTSANPIAVFTAGSRFEQFTSTGSYVTFRFVSNASTNSKGWMAEFECTSTAQSAATYLMSDAIIYTCGGTFTDNGGTSGNYSDNTSYTQTFHSGNGNRIKFDFSSYDTWGNDNLKVYDGPNTSYPLIANLGGTLSAFSIESTGSQLTFVFSPDNNNTSKAGWAASISCTTPTLTSYNMSSGTVTACSGVFYDDGGASANYTDNQDQTMTFYSGSSSFLQFTFNTTATSLSSGDSLFVYDGSSTSANPIAVFTSSSRFEQFTSTGSYVTFRFVSNASTNSKGWLAEFECTSTAQTASTYLMSNEVIYTCGGTFTDNGGTSGNYSDNASYTQTFASANGNRVQVSFSSFATYDNLKIYDGPNATYPLIGSYIGSLGAFSVQSTGSQLTFVFSPDNNNTTTSGWVASLSCTTPTLTSYNMSSGTVTSCAGIFYDDGGANSNYSNSQDRTMTFYSGSSSFLQFTFNTAATSISGSDSLFVYDGNSTASNPIAVFTSGSRFEQFTSTGSYITFRFKSDASGNSSGWQAQFACTSTAQAASTYLMSNEVIYTCGGTFTDNGGTSGNYSDNNSYTQTFCSANGNRIKFDFSSYDTWGNDNLKVYDGPNTSYPLIAYLGGTLGTFSIESSGSQLTFVFSPDNNGTNKAGWSASISCTTPVLTSYNMSSGTVTACSGVFYDDGGASANYTDNQDRTMTFSSGSSKLLEFTFTSSSTSLNSGDSLYVFDGSSTSANPIAIFVQNSKFEKITSTGSSLTFRFKSDNSGNAVGWRALFQCVDTAGTSDPYLISAGVRYIYSGSYTFTDDGGASGNYNDAVSHTETFISSSGCGLKVTFSQFATYDYLKVYDGPNTSSSLIGSYISNQNGLVVQSTGNALTFQFITNNGGTSNTGWIATIAPANSTPAPIPSYTSPACEGSTLNLAAGSISNATYSWTGPNGFTSSVQNPSISNATVSMSGTYYVSAQIGTCSSIQKSVNVSVTAKPTMPVAGNNGPVCQGSKIDLTSTTVSGATYSWTGPNSFTSSSQNPSISNTSTAASGTYTVTATVNGCSSSASTTATIDPSYTVSPSSNSPVCSGSDLSLNLNTVAGATYSWTGPNSFTSSSQNPVITAVGTSANGTYTATISKGSCSISATVNITVNNPPSVTASSNSPICEGSDLNLNVSNVAGATYSWTGPNSFASSSQNPIITAATTSASGSYSVSIISGGCSVTKTISVSVNPSPGSVTASSNGPICEGSDLTLNVTAIASATYSWTGPNSFTSSQQNPTITTATINASGTYTVTVNTGSCSITSKVNATVNAVPSITASSNSPLCAGSDLNLSVTTISGGSYSWTGPGSFTSTMQNPSISTAATVASGNYSITVNDGNCSASKTISVVVNTSPGAVTASSNGPICEGSDLNLSSTTVAGATYSWTGPNGFTSAIQNPMISSALANASGNYTVNISIGTCSSSATVAATVNTVGSVSASNDGPACEGNAINLNATQVAGASYSWSGPNGFTSSVRNPSINSVSAPDGGTYSVNVRVGSCSKQASTVIVVNSAPATPTITFDNFNNTFKSSASSGNQWYLNSQSIFGETNQTMMSFGPGNYSVTVTDPNGCSSTSAVYHYLVNAVSNGTLAGKVSVYPNPSNGVFKIDINNVNASEIKLKVTNAFGSEVYSNITNAASSEIDITALDSGIYFLHIMSGSDEETIKLIID